MRGLKQKRHIVPGCAIWGRTLTGAWIETPGREKTSPTSTVAPSRVRGLKLLVFTIAMCPKKVAPSRVRGLKPQQAGSGVAVAGRTLTGAWIETRYTDLGKYDWDVAPSRVRGLKHGDHERILHPLRSHPHGCVD